MRREDTSDPLDFRDDSRLKLPMRWAATIGAVLVGGATIWTTLLISDRQQEQRITALESKFEAQREILSDIRYDVKQIRERRP